MWFAKGARELAGELSELSRHRDLMLALQDIQGHWQDNLASLKHQLERATSVDEPRVQELQASLRSREEQHHRATRLHRRVPHASQDPWRPVVPRARPLPTRRQRRAVEGHRCNPGNHR